MKVLSTLSTFTLFVSTDSWALKLPSTYEDNGIDNTGLPSTANGERVLDDNTGLTASIIEANTAALSDISTTLKDLATAQQDTAAAQQDTAAAIA